MVVLGWGDLAGVATGFGLEKWLRGRLSQPGEAPGCTSARLCWLKVMAMGLGRFGAGRRDGANFWLIAVGIESCLSPGPGCRGHLAQLSRHADNHVSLGSWTGAAGDTSEAVLSKSMVQCLLGR